MKKILFIIFITVFLILSTNQAVATNTYCLKFDQFDANKVECFYYSWYSDKECEYDDSDKFIYVEAYDSKEECEKTKSEIIAGGFCKRITSEKNLECVAKVADEGKYCTPDPQNLYKLVFFNNYPECRNKIVDYKSIKAEATTAEATETDLKVDLQLKPPIVSIKLPTLSNFTDVANTLDSEGYIHLPWMGEYISAAYKFGLVVISIVAVIMIILTGAKIMVGGGEARVEGFKKIGQIAVGLFIAWGSYAILYNINPALVKFDAVKIQYIKPEEIKVDDFSDPAYSNTTGNPIDKPSEFPDFKQINYNTKFGFPDTCPDDTIAHKGCGPTSLADVVKSFGYDVDPPKMAEEWLNTKYMIKKTCSAIGSGGMFQDKAFLEKYKLNSENIGPNKDKIINALKNGKPVIASMKRSRFTKIGHFIVLVKMNDDGTVFVRDPGRRALCVRDINKCPGEPTVSLTSVNPDWLFPFIKAASAFSKR